MYVMVQAESIIPTMIDKAKAISIARGALILAVAALIGAWLILTPEGILGKADAIGYSVCHRIAERSFTIAGRQMPLCARCTGMYLGMLTGLLLQLPAGRRTQFPPLKIALPLGILALAFALDGINSTRGLFPGVQEFYPPGNFLRLLTGAGMGVLVPLYLLPVFHQTLWAAADERSILERWPQALVLLGAAGGTALLIYTDVPAILFGLAILSALTVPLILGMCYALFWVIIFRKENAYTRIQQAWVPLLAGLATAMLQVGLIDLLRYRFTGTWAGFQI